MEWACEWPPFELWSRRCADRLILCASCSVSVGGKNANNLGTLWRSAFQLDAAFLFTVGGRYKVQATDTVNAASHLL